MLTRLQRNWTTPTLLGGVCNGADTLESSVAVSDETTMCHSNCTLRHVSQRNENLRSQKTLCMDTYSSSAHESQTLTATRMSFNKWILKHSYVEHYSAINRNELLAHTAMDNSAGNYAE